MPDYGTDKLSLQNTTGAILSASGDALLSTNSDSSQAVVFGAIATREIQTAIANGAFDSQPPLPDEIIDEETNPIAYWSVSDSSGGTITAKSIPEATNPSGFTIGITIPTSTPSGLSWSMSTYFPITGNSAEVLALDPIVYLDVNIGVLGTANINVVLTMEFADVDFAPVGGTAYGTATYSDLAMITISPAEKSVSTGTRIAPPEAAFGKLTITTTTVGTVSTTGTPIVYVREAMVRRGFSFIPISDNAASLQPAASISHSGGELMIASGSRSLDGLGTVRLLALNDTFGGTSTSALLSTEQNPTAPSSPDPSATFTMSGMGLSPTIVLSSTESAGDVNLYRNTADVWKTDDSLIVGTDLTVGGSATITGNLSAGGISFTNLEVSGTANIVGTATFGTTVNFSGGSVNLGADVNIYRTGTNALRTDDVFVVGSRNTPATSSVDRPGFYFSSDVGFMWGDRDVSGNTDATLFLSSGFLNSTLQMIRFFRKITSGGTALSATGHILVANNTTTAPSFGAGSDYRLKENIRTANVEVDFLEKINDLRPVFYTEKETGDELLGFIAHEVQAVIPEAVEGEKDAVDENGDPMVQNLYAAKFIPYLIGAVQELSAKAADLESRLAQLENK